MASEAAQDNTATLPGYSKAELQSFQALDPTLGALKKFWDKQRKPTYQERVSLPKPVCSLLKQWLRIREKDGLLYREIKDAHVGKRHQLMLPACLFSKACMIRWGIRA